MTMWIERTFPEAISAKSDIPTRFRVSAEAKGISQEKIKAIIELLPRELIEAGVFLDKMTNIWRYEFGQPYDFDGQLWFGTHMWEEVDRLLDTMLCVYERISVSKRSAYLRLLATEAKHPDVLAEMIPGIKLPSEISAEFEVPGLGQGSRTVDWLITSDGGRRVLCDVKRRSADFIQHMVQLGNAKVAPDPTHDPALLFKSVEQKFCSNDPTQLLQGAWIVTSIAQNENELIKAFNLLDKTRVHYVILGDWEADAYILVRRRQDIEFLQNLFGLGPSVRFVFTPGDDNLNNASDDVSGT